MKILASLLLSLLVAAPASAATPAKQAGKPAAAPAAKAAPAAEVDMARVIRDVGRKAPGMLIAAPQAAQRMDRMLAADYGARGSIAGERDVRLKSLYVEAAHLMLNGYTIAGGTLVMIARQEAAFARSPVGPAYVQFVNAMLAPTSEHDDELTPLAARAAKGRALLGPVRPRLQMAAQLTLMGGLYGDAVAEKAGREALRLQGATPAELAAIAAARKAAGISP